MPQPQKMWINSVWKAAVSPVTNKVLRHGRDVHPTWAKLFTKALGSGFEVLSTRAKSGGTLTVTDEKWLTALGNQRP